MWNLLVGTNKHVSSEENGGVLLKHNQNTHWQTTKRCSEDNKEVLRGGCQYVRLRRFRVCIVIDLH